MSLEDWPAVRRSVPPGIRVRTSPALAVIMLCRVGIGHCVLNQSPTAAPESGSLVRQAAFLPLMSAASWQCRSVSARVVRTKNSIVVARATSATLPVKSARIRARIHCVHIARLVEIHAHTHTHARARTHTHTQRHERRQQSCLLRLRSASCEAGSSGADGRRVWLVRRKDTGATYTVARQRDRAVSAGGARGNGCGPVVMPTLSRLTSVSMVTESCLPLFHSVGVQVRAADCARVLNRLRQLGWTPGYSSVGIGQADVDVEELVRLCCCALIRELLEAAGGGSGKRDLRKGLDLKYLAMAANCLRCVGPL